MGSCQDSFIQSLYLLSVNEMDFPDGNEAINYFR